MIRATFLALLALVTVTVPAVAQTRAPPAQRTGPIAITGPGSTGDVSGMSAKLPASGSIARTLVDRLQEIRISVLDFQNADGTPVKCDNTQDDSFGIQSAVNFASISGKTTEVYFPAMCRTTAAISVPNAKPIVLRGRGPGTGIRQTGASADGVTFINTDYIAQTVGVKDMTIESGAGYQTANSFAPGSTGTGLKAVRQTIGFTLQNVWVTGFANGVSFYSVHNTENYNLKVNYFSGDGLRIDSDPGDGSAGNSFIGGIIGNAGYTGNASASAGIHVLSSGGEFVYGFDVVATYNAVLVNPPVGKQVAYLWFGRVLGDTSIGDGWVLDGSAGSVIRTDISSSWASYGSQNGIVTKGGNLKGLNLANFGMRQNVLRGWYNQGGSGINFINSDIAENSRTSSGTYPGVEVADGVTGNDTFSIVGGSSGNKQGGAATQGAAIKFAGAASGFRITSHNMSDQGSGKPMLDVANWSSLTNYVMNDNLPAASGLNRTGAQSFASAGNVNAGTTSYIGPIGMVSDPNVAPWFSPAIRLASSVYVAVTSAPGAGQSYTYRLVQNGTPVGATGVMSGAGSFAVTFSPGVTLSRDDTFSVQVVTTSGTPVATHRARVLLEP